MIKIDPRVHWCARHLEPFRAEWPRGYVLASAALVEEAVRQQEVLAACGYDGSEGSGNPELLDRVLREFGPLCCLVGDEKAAKWTQLALAGDTYSFAVALDELRTAPWKGTP